MGLGFSSLPSTPPHPLRNGKYLTHARFRKGKLHNSGHWCLWRKLCPYSAMGSQPWEKPAPCVTKDDSSIMVSTLLVLLLGSSSSAFPRLSPFNIVRPCWSMIMCGLVHVECACVESDEPWGVCVPVKPHNPYNQDNISLLSFRTHAASILLLGKPQIWLLQISLCIS